MWMLVESLLVAATCFLLANLARKIPSQAVHVNAAKQPRILVIDGFRVVAVSVIMLKHGSVAGTWPDAALRAFDAADGAMGGSRPILFIVSGFVISYVFAQKVEQLDLSTSMAFIARRLGRLAPAYYAALVLDFVTSTIYYNRIGPSDNDARSYEVWLHGQAHRVAFVADASLLQSFLSLPMCGMDELLTFLGLGQGWFTSAVAILSCCFPPAFNVISQLTAAEAVGLLVCIIALRTLCAFARLTFAHPGAMNLGTFAPWNLFPFIMGMLCAHICKRATEGMRWLGWGFVLDSLFALWIWGALRGITPNAGLCAQAFHSALCCVLCFAAYGVALNQEAVHNDRNAGLRTQVCHSGITGHVLSQPALVRLAELSFSAYILNMPVARMFIYEFGMKQQSLCWLPFTAAWVIGSALVPFLETPVRKSLDSFIKAD
jgi:peptidoglycan/LPS O-acetylase OafA/YrhL